jgi:hypothetical protein
MHTNFCLENLKGRPRHRWEVNIGMDLWTSVHLAQDRDQWWALVNTVLNLWVHKGWGI